MTRCSCGQAATWQGYRDSKPLPVYKCSGCKPDPWLSGRPEQNGLYFRPLEATMFGVYVWDGDTMLVKAVFSTPEEAGEEVTRILSSGEATRAEACSLLVNPV